MSEIIKELLEKLKQCDDFHNRCDFLMEHSEITYMLDYITNLQQENKQLEENYDRIYNENCILREKHNINDIGLLDENYKLQKVIDKAIEYIRSNDIEVLKYHDIPSETSSYEIVTVDLLKTLKGGENE